MNRRVVVTGTGLVIPQGIGTKSSWEKICSGISGIDRITRFDTSDYPVKIAGEVRGFKTEDFFERKEARHLDPFTQFAIVSARMALEESGFVLSEDNRDRVGVIIGCGMGGLPKITAQHEAALNKGFKKDFTVFHYRSHSEYAVRQHIDGYRQQGPKPHLYNRLCGWDPCGRRGLSPYQIRYG